MFGPFCSFGHPFIKKSISLHKWKDRISGIHLIEGNVNENDLAA